MGLDASGMGGRGYTWLKALERDFPIDDCMKRFFPCIVGSGFEKDTLVELLNQTE